MAASCNHLLLAILILFLISFTEANGISQGILKTLEDGWEFLQEEEVRLDSYFGEPLGRTYRNCIDNQKKKCNFDNFYDCLERKGQESYYCKRKDVFPLENIEILGYALIFLISQVKINSSGFELCISRERRRGS